MGEMGISTLLNSDPRFTKRGTKFAEVAVHINQLFNCSEEFKTNVKKDEVKWIKSICDFLNQLQAINKQGDLVFIDDFNLENISKLPELDLTSFGYTQFELYELKSVLGDDYLDYRNYFADFEDSEDNKKSEFIKNLISHNKSSKKSFEQNISSTLQECIEDYWIKALDLYNPMIPQPDISKIEYQGSVNNQEYCIYGERIVPWAQCQISAVTNLNSFSNQDILNLFPPFRIYTRSPYLYQTYDKLEYDDDLGVIFKIKGFTRKQIIKNIIEYPHLEGFDRIVKVKGREELLPFWKHIEIDGQIVSTASIWDTLPDTKILPKTESFMNEYVVRRYILERDKGVTHKYKMRGTLEPFLTLYDDTNYYVNKGYDPIEIGKRCIQSRKSFKFSRNPVLRKLGITD